MCRHHDCVIFARKVDKILSTNKMAAFLNQDIETLDLEEVSRKFTLQSKVTIAGSSTMTVDEGFMRRTDERVKHEYKFADVNFNNKSVWEAIAKP